MFPTPYEDVNSVLNQLNTGLQKILGANLVGLYLTGSLTYGDFKSGSSDIDYLAIINNELSEKELEGIRNLHKLIGEQYPQWRKRTEGSYTLKKWFESVERPQGERWYFNAGVLTPNRYGNEWALNMSMLYECGVTLYGPDPKTIIKQVKINEVKESSKRSLLEEWQKRLSEKTPFEDEGYDTNHIKSYSILTMCRVLYREQSDNIASKRVASAWTKINYPQWKDLIEKAENWEHGKILDEDQKIKDFIKFAVEEIENKKS